MKVHSLGSSVNSPESSFKTDLKPRLDKWQLYSQMYSERKHWVESGSKGMRYCWMTYNNKKDTWGKPQYDKWIPFFALVFDFGKLRKIYVTEETHITDIEKDLRKYIYDPEQMKVLEQVMEAKRNA